MSSHAGFATLSTIKGLHNYNGWIWKQIAPFVGQRVMEAGCGTGTMTQYLSSRRRLVAVDIDQHYVSGLKERYAERSNVRVEWADLASNDWPDLSHEHIDTIVSMNVLEHLEDDAGDAQAVLRAPRSWRLPGVAGAGARVTVWHAGHSARSLSSLRPRQPGQPAGPLRIRGHVESVSESKWRIRLVCQQPHTATQSRAAGAGHRLRLAVSAAWTD